jgi:hypothetical protein
VAIAMRVVSPLKRHALWLAVLSLLGGFVLSGLTTVPASAATKTWNLATDFGSHPNVNPAPDQYGDAAVWSWMDGTLNMPSTYQLMNSYTNPRRYKTSCGVKSNAWAQSGATTSVLYVKKAFVAGSDRCAPNDAAPAMSVVMNPQYQGVGSPASIVSWTSPVNKTVMVSGSLTGIDPAETGITYELDQGTTVLVGPTAEGSDVTSSFGPVAVTVSSGQVLYLEVGDGSSSNGLSDAILVKFTITS